MNYVTNTLLLVSSSVRSKQLLCSVHRQGQKSEQKHITKKFVGFHNNSPLLTMVQYSVYMGTSYMRIKVVLEFMSVKDFQIATVSDKFKGW